MGVTERPRLLIPGKVITMAIAKKKNNGHLPYHCSFYYLARASMHDVVFEFACAARMGRNN